MATRLKTIEYYLSEMDSISDNVATNFSQITVDIPEGSPDFRSVTLEMIWHDATTTTNNTTSRALAVQLGSAGYTTVNNANLMTQSGEDVWYQFAASFTDYFNTNWAGTSMTFDARATINSAATTPVIRAVTCKVTITYAYDDTATTQVKTVRIPLFASYVQLATAKPGTAQATIPALDTWLPEASVSIKQIAVVIQGNEESAATTDMTMTMQIDTLTSWTTATHEKGRATSSWYRHTWHPSFTTSATHGFYLWASAADFDHPQVWMVVTYTFDESTTTTVMNSLILPMEVNSPAGGPTSADWQAASRQLYIEEPGTITMAESAVFVHYEERAAVTGINARIAGDASFHAITSVAATVGGGCGFMLPGAESFISLSRGKNEFGFHIYRTDSVDLVWNISSWWIVNYTSGRHTDGVGAHNHTVIRNLLTHDTSASDNNRTTGALSPSLPETYWFMNSVGLNYQYITNTTGNPTGVSIQVERLAAEGGIAWEQIYNDSADSDPEVGVHHCWATARSVFLRWPNDPGDGRITLQTARRYKAYLALGANSWDHLDLYMTYHSITFPVSGEVTGSNGGTVNLVLHRDGTGEKVLETSRTGDGTYTVTWYDDTENLFVQAYEDATHVGRSDTGVAG